MSVLNMSLTTLFVVLMAKYKNASRKEIEDFEELVEKNISKEEYWVAGFIVEEMRYFRGRK